MVKWRMVKTLLLILSLMLLSGIGLYAGKNALFDQYSPELQIHLNLMIVH